MRLNREQVLSLSDACHIALTERETAALETELNNLLALTERLTDGNTANGTHDTTTGTSIPCHDVRRERAMGRVL